MPNKKPYKYRAQREKTKHISLLQHRVEPDHFRNDFQNGIFSTGIQYLIRDQQHHTDNKSGLARCLSYLNLLV